MKQINPSLQWILARSLYYFKPEKVADLDNCNTEK